MLKKENWTYFVNPNDFATWAAATRNFEGELSPGSVDEIEEEQYTFLINFQPTAICYPIFGIKTDEETTGLQLRVDEREIYRPRYVDFRRKPAGIVFSFFDTSDETPEKFEEGFNTALSLVANLMIGNNLRVKLEPSGKVMLWPLRGSKKAIEKSMKRCAEGLKNQQYFTE